MTEREAYYNALVIYNGNTLTIARVPGTSAAEVRAYLAERYARVTILAVTRAA